MHDILTGSFGRPSWFETGRTFHVVDWNIERGLKLPGIIAFLKSGRPDLVLLQEVDVNTRRTGQVNVAEEIARALQMNYVFGCEFVELVEGSKNSPALTGQATLSRWPLLNPRLIRFRDQSTFWQPHWWIPDVRPFQERVGGRIALHTEMRVPGASVFVYNMHLESRGPDRLRASQFEEVLGEACRTPRDCITIMAGDMNFHIEDAPCAHRYVSEGFRDAVDQPDVPTTTRRGLFNAGRVIDRALVRGPVSISHKSVNRYVRASDHYPVSFLLERL